MMNIGSMLKQEISRLSRRELRREVGAMRRASAQYRRDIAALKRQSAELLRRVALLSGSVLSNPKSEAPAETEKSVRFVAKGLRSNRQRLGLSAAEYGALVGVSAQSVYNWERGLASPRQAQLASLATLRGMGKREARARLDQLGAKESPAKRKR